MHGQEAKVSKRLAVLFHASKSKRHRPLPFTRPKGYDEGSRRQRASIICHIRVCAKVLTSQSLALLFAPTALKKSAEVLSDRHTEPSVSRFNVFGGNRRLSATSNGHSRLFHFETTRCTRPIRRKRSASKAPREPRVVRFALSIPPRALLGGDKGSLHKSTSRTSHAFRSEPICKSVFRCFSGAFGCLAHPHTKKGDRRPPIHASSDFRAKNVNKI